MTPAVAVPAGDVTLMFTDIEGSTRSWDKYQETFRVALDRHNELLRQAIAENNGYEVKTIGDSFMVAFSSPLEAACCALRMQQLIEAEPFEAIGGMRVRIGLHTGTVSPHGGDYFGPPVNRAARVESSAHGGQTVMSEETARRIEDHLPSGARLMDAGMHRLKDLGAPLRLFLVTHEELPEREYPPLRTMDVLPNNFPAQVTSFVGREREIRELNELLRVQKARLVTMTGPGGTGKTRLSLQVAAENVQAYQDGVWLVELANITDPREVPTAVAIAIKLEMKSDQDAKRQIFDALREKRSLLVFDNFEHVIDAAGFISSLLKECRNLVCLVTSQHLLQVAGEQEYPVAPLDLPPARVKLNDCMNYGSVRLFADRAESARPGFTITEENLPAIADICRQLDGMPLAIELTATLVRAMTPQQLLPRMKDRFKLLASSRRDLEPRQRSLRGAMDWSYELMNEDERALFQELAVFAGGCFLEDVEAVCSAPDAFLLIFNLRDKSLLNVSEVNGETRFAMLKTLREYGQEKLAQADNPDGPHQLHAQRYLEKAQQLSGEMLSSPEAVQRMNLEIDNMRAGMDWAAQQNDHEMVTSFGSALARFFMNQGLWSEGDQRLLMAVKASQISDNRKNLAQLYLWLGQIAYRRADWEEARRLWFECYTINKELGDKLRLVPALYYLGLIAWEQTDFIIAQERWTEALELSKETQQPRYEDALLGSLAMLASERGEFEEAVQYYEAGLAIHKKANNQVEMAVALQNFSDVLRRQKQFETAKKKLNESRQLFEELKHKHGIASAHIQASIILLEAGDYKEAACAAQEGLEMAQEIGDQRWEMYALSVLARLAGNEGNLPDATSIFLRCAVIAREVQDTKFFAEMLFHYGAILFHHKDYISSYRLVVVANREYGEKPMYNAARTKSLLEALRGLLPEEIVQKLDQEALLLSCEEAFQSIA